MNNSEENMQVDTGVKRLPLDDSPDSTTKNPVPTKSFLNTVEYFNFQTWVQGKLTKN